MRNHFDKLAEEVVCDLARRTTHQARTDLGKLATDLQRGSVLQGRITIGLGERHVGTALAEARRPAFAFTTDGVTLWRI